MDKSSQPPPPPTPEQYFNAVLFFNILQYDKCKKVESTSEGEETGNDGFEEQEI